MQSTSLGITSEKILTYKSDNRESSKNTMLLDAIDSNNTELALLIIKEDEAQLGEKSIINQAALGNTPLLLALKKGNFKIVEALLAHAKIDIKLQDDRGLTALHWACMLRADHIIKCLLNKGADPHQEVEWSKVSEIDEVGSLTPFHLYIRDVSLDSFKNYCKFFIAAQKFSSPGYCPYSNDHYLGRIHSDFLYPLYWSVFFNSWNSASYQSGFADRKDLAIPGSMTYTDIIFHMADICVNFGWIAAEEFLSFKTCASSQKIFFTNFSVGMGAFCEKRNAIPINAELYEKMWQMNEDKHRFDPVVSMCYPNSQK